MHTHTLLVQIPAVCVCIWFLLSHTAPRGLRLSSVQAGHNVELMFYSCFLTRLVCVELLLLLRFNDPVMFHVSD